MTPALVILDRDGVINAESRDHVKSVAEWRPLPGSLEAVVRLTRAGVQVAMATNQSGIARGLLAESDLAEIHAHMNAELARLGGGPIEPIFHSPHGPDADHPMSKPRPGMLEAIAAHLGCGLAGVPFVGDSWRDIAAARAAGAQPVLVRTGHGRTALATVTDLDGVRIHDDLAAFVDDLLGDRPVRPR